MPQFDLEKVLMAAKQIGDNLQNELNRTTAENEDLKKENENLKAEIKSLREDNEILHLEMEDMNSAKNALREANETFGKNLNQLMGQLNKTIEENHKAFIAQVNQIMHDEFQKFLSEYMDKIRSTAETRVSKIEETQPVQEENISADMVVVETESNLPSEKTSKKQRMMYADFYAVENVAVEEDEVNHKIDYKSRIKPPPHK